MEKASNGKRVERNCLRENVPYKRIKEDLKAQIRTMDVNKKRLEEELDTIRERFTRFYFISDEEMLLMIVAQQKELADIEVFLPNLYEGVYKLEGN
jgi:hypothetical protein